eukprot:365148-Chlamydomonas_euryale.AAC.18
MAVFATIAIASRCHQGHRLMSNVMPGDVVGHRQEGIKGNTEPFHTTMVGTQQMHESVKLYQPLQV